MAILERQSEVRARIQPGDILLAGLLAFIPVWAGVHGLLVAALLLLGVVMLYVCIGSKR